MTDKFRFGITFECLKPLPKGKIDRTLWIRVSLNDSALDVYIYMSSLQWGMCVSVEVRDDTQTHDTTHRFRMETDLCRQR